MIFGYKTKNDRKIEELERKSKDYFDEIVLLQQKVDDLEAGEISNLESRNNLYDNIEKEKKFTKERFIEYIDKRTHLYTGLHERLEKIESIGDFEVLMKRVARVEEQFGPILGKVTDTFQSAMNTLISEAGKTNQYIAKLAKEKIDKALTIEKHGDEVTIILNGEEIPIVKNNISYENICALAGVVTEKTPTIAYSNSGSDEDGKLVEGQSLFIKEGTVIDIYGVDNT